MTDPNLVTTCNLHGQDYLVKMNVINSCLEILISDKQTGEEWNCSYDNSYIEQLTHKTGNFKQFDVFITMLKSGLLKTSSSITLDLLTYDDLESLRIRRLKSATVTRNLGGNNNNNRRYLILTYSVEFDRIHYPLPLEYCGPPDPLVLQSTIRKLEGELSEAKELLTSKNNKAESKQIIKLQNRVEDLLFENNNLLEEIRQLKNHKNIKPVQNYHTLQKAITNLEKSVLTERRSHHQLVEKLRREKVNLVREIEKFKSTEKALRLKLDQLLTENKCLKSACRNSADTVRTMYRRKRSPIIRNHETSEVIRTRSLSPRATKSEGWNFKCDNMMDLGLFDGKSNFGLRSRSRESSFTSLKLSDLEDNVNRDVGRLKKKSFTMKPSKEVTKLKNGRMRSGSPSSIGSSASTKSKKSDTASLKMMIKNSELEFKNLEERIEGLQNLLKNNFP